MSLGVTIVLVVMAAIICLLWGEVCKNYGYKQAMNEVMKAAKTAAEQQQKQSEEAKNALLNLFKGAGKPSEKE